MSLKILAGAADFGGPVITELLIREDIPENV
jgi:hypothetical protein